MTTTAQMTAAEFLALAPHRSADRRELVGGELVVSGASWMHNGAQLAVAYALQAWARTAPGRGSVGLPLDVALDERNVYLPDVVWYCEGRALGATTAPHTRSRTSPSRSDRRRPGTTTSA